MSFFGFIFTICMLIGGWCIVGITFLILQVCLFKFYDYAEWLGACRRANGTVKFDEAALVAAILLWPCNLIWMFVKAVSKTPFSLQTMLNRVIDLRSKKQD